jgi:hypothetical protein
LAGITPGIESNPGKKNAGIKTPSRIAQALPALLGSAQSSKKSSDSITS